MKREEMIEKLVQNDVNAIERGDYDVVDIYDILEFGFDGYTKMTTSELLELINLYEIK